MENLKEKVALNKAIDEISSGNEELRGLLNELQSLDVAGTLDGEVVVPKKLKTKIKQEKDEENEAKNKTENIVESNEKEEGLDSSKKRIAQKQETSEAHRSSSVKIAEDENKEEAAFIDELTFVKSGHISNVTSAEYSRKIYSLAEDDKNTSIDEKFAKIFGGYREIENNISQTQPSVVPTPSPVPSPVPTPTPTPSPVPSPVPQPQPQPQPNPSTPTPRGQISAPSVKFTEDANSNGVINNKENASDGDASHTAVRINLPADVLRGDKIKGKIVEPDGNVTEVFRDVTSLDIIKGFVEIKVPAISGTYLADFRLVDSSGNEGIRTDTSIRVDIGTVAKPIIEKINGASPYIPTNDVSPKITVYSPAGVPELRHQDGSKIPATVTDLGNGRYDLKPTVAINPDDTYALAITHSENESDPSKVNIVRGATPPPTPPTPPVPSRTQGDFLFTEDSIPTDNVINKLENGRDGNINTTNIKIKLPSDTVSGDRITVDTMINGTPYMQTKVIDDADIARGHIDAPIVIGDGLKSVVTVKVLKSDGGLRDSITKEIGADLTPPSAPSRVKFVEDADNNGVINKIENRSDGDEAKTALKIDIPSDAKSGDILTIKIDENGVERTITKTLSDHDIANAEVIELIPISDNKNINVEVFITDKAGNKGDNAHAEVTTALSGPSMPTIVSIDGKTPRAPTNDSTPTILVRSADGIPSLVDDNGAVIPSSVVDNGDGTYSITPNSPLTDGTIINIIATDNQGNKSSKVSINSGIDTTAPSASTGVRFVEDINNNGVINTLENKRDNSTGTTSVEVTLPADAKKGDTVEIKITKPDATVEAITKVLTQEDINATKTTLSVPVEQGSHTLSITLIDEAGNRGASINSNINMDVSIVRNPVVEAINGDPVNKPTKDTTPTFKIKSPDGIPSLVDENGDVIASTLVDLGNNEYTLTPNSDVDSDKIYVKATSNSGNVSDSVKIEYVFDNVAPSAPMGITFSEDANNDNVLNKKESETDGNIANTGIKVIIPSGIVAGDKIEVKITHDGNVTTSSSVITSADLLNGYVTATASVADGKTTTIEAGFTDIAGNVGATVNKTISSDFTAPNAPTITSVDGKAPGSATSNTKPAIVVHLDEGTPVLVNASGNPISATVTDNGGGNFTITPNTPYAQGSTIYVAAKDSAGNISSYTSVASGIDTTAPNPPTALKFIEDANNDGIINIAENGGDGSQAQTTLRVSFGADVEAGDKVKYRIHGGANIVPGEKLITATDIANGYVDINIPTDITDNPSVAVSLVDGVGNESGSRVSNIVLDLTATRAPELLKVNGNDIGIPTNDDTPTFTVKSMGGVSKLVDNGGTTIPSTLVDKGNGVYELTPNSAVTQGNVNVVAVSNNGNVSNVVAIPFILDQTPPSAPTGIVFTENTNGDRYLNKLENESDGDTSSTNVDIMLPTNAKVGDKVSIVTQFGGTGTINTEVILEASHITAGKVSISAPTVNGTATKITAKLTDVAGNEGTTLTGEALVRTTFAHEGSSTPTLNFVEDVNNDDVLNKAENQSDSNITSTKVRIDLPAGSVSLNDRIMVKTELNGVISDQQLVIDNTHIANGKIEFDAPVSNGKETKITAKVIDYAGNIGETFNKTITSYIDAPAKPTYVKFPEDVNENGHLTSVEDNRDAQANSTEIKIGIPANATPGSTLKFSIDIDGSIQTRDVQITNQMIADGFTTIRSNIGTTINKVTTSILDPYGNVSENTLANLDHRSITLTANLKSIDDRENIFPNFVTNKVKPVFEIQAFSSISGTSQRFPAKVKMQYEDGAEIELRSTGLAIGSYRNFIPIEPLRENAKSKLIVSDDYGNEKELKSFLGMVDATPPEAVTNVDFVEDLNKDGILTKQENRIDNRDYKTRVKITLPSSINAGDVLKVETIVDGSRRTEKYDIFSSDKNNGYKIIDVDVSHDKNTTVKITPIDRAKNEGVTTTKTIFSKIEEPGAPKYITFVEDVNNNNVLGMAENASDGDSTKTKVKIGIPDNFSNPGTAEISVNNARTVKTILAEDIARGYIEMDLSTAPDKITVKAQFIDDVGNAGTEIGKTIDTTKLSKPVFSFVEDADNDGTITATENKSDHSNWTNIKISLDSNYKVGDTINIIANGKTIGQVKVDANDLISKTIAKTLGIVGTKDITLEHVRGEDKVVSYQKTITVERNPLVEPLIRPEFSFGDYAPTVGGVVNNNVTFIRAYLDSGYTAGDTVQGVFHITSTNQEYKTDKKAITKNDIERGYIDLNIPHQVKNSYGTVRLVRGYEGEPVRETYNSAEYARATENRAYAMGDMGVNYNPNTKKTDITIYKYDIMTREHSEVRNTLNYPAGTSNDNVSDRIFDYKYISDPSALYGRILNVGKIYFDKNSIYLDNGVAKIDVTIFGERGDTTHRPEEQKRTFVLSSEDLANGYMNLDINRFDSASISNEHGFGIKTEIKYRNSITNAIETETHIETFRLKDFREQATEGSDTIHVIRAPYDYSKGLYVDAKGGDDTIITNADRIFVDGGSGVDTVVFKRPQGDTSTTDVDFFEFNANNTQSSMLRDVEIIDLGKNDGGSTRMTTNLEAIARLIDTFSSDREYLTFKGDSRDKLNITLTSHDSLVKLEGGASSNEYDRYEFISYGTKYQIEVDKNIELNVY